MARNRGPREKRRAAHGRSQRFLDFSIIESCSLSPEECIEGDLLQLRATLRKIFPTECVSLLISELRHTRNTCLLTDIWTSGEKTDQAFCRSRRLRPVNFEWEGSLSLTRDEVRSICHSKGVHQVALIQPANFLAPTVAGHFSALVFVRPLPRKWRKTLHSQSTRWL